MLCISVAYAVMRCPSVCPSICLSACPSICHARRLLKWINVTSKFFSPSGSHTILVFPYQTSWQYFNGDPIMEALNAGGVGKNRDSQLISGYRDRRLVECKQQLRWSIVQFTAWTAMHQWSCLASKDDLLLLLVCVSFTIIGQPRNSVLIRRV